MVIQNHRKKQDKSPIRGSQWSLGIGDSAYKDLTENREWNRKMRIVILRCSVTGLHHLHRLQSRYRRYRSCRPQYFRLGYYLPRYFQAVNRRQGYRRFRCRQR